MNSDWIFGNSVELLSGGRGEVGIIDIKKGSPCF